MKKNRQTFVVSYWKEMWEERTGDIFIVDPYIYHLFERDEICSSFNYISVADFLCTTRDELEVNVRLTQKKYELYTEILAIRLNEIHGLTYSLDFWRKCLSCGFMRYLQQFHYMFTLLEAYFNENYSCAILSPARYYLPRAFEDHRHVFEATHLGQEQIFSLYIQLFYPGQFSMRSPEPLPGELLETSLREAAPQCLSPFRLLWEKFRQKKRLFFRKTASALFPGLIRDTCLTDSTVIVGILDSFFAAQHVNFLRDSTSGAIQLVKHGIVFPSRSGCEPDREKRAYLGSFNQNFDRFDQFFFSTLPHCFPTAYIESFSPLLEGANRFQERYPRMKDIICEAWLSDTVDSIVLAYLKEKKEVRHHYNEHNCFFQPFVGDMCRFQAKHVDVFVSMGWEDSSITNLYPGASLFPFSVPVQENKEYDLLYVSYSATARMGQYASDYASTGPYAQRYLNFLKTFFENLSTETTAMIAYRGYPEGYCIKSLRYDNEFYLFGRNNNLYNIPAVYTKGQTCKEQMARARLVIVSYTSTAYMEALHMNVPVIFFWDPESKFISPECADFYQPLIEAGICQTEPKRAAAFVEQVKDDPEGWWASAFVQNRRKAFMEKNFKPPEDMIRYLKKLL